MLFIRHHAALVIFQCVGQTAGLRAVAAVGAAPGLSMGNIALAGIGHAQRAVDEELNGRVGVIVNRFDLLKIQLAGEHDLAEADVGEKFRFLNAADIALGAGVQLNRRNIQLHDPHVLDNQRVDAGFIQVGYQALRRFQLIIMKNGVQGHEHFRAVAMGKRYQTGDIAQAVAGVVARAKARPADVDRIRAV